MTGSSADLQHWYFAERRDKREEWLERNEDPEEVWQEPDAWAESELKPFWTSRLLPYWTGGGDGEGEDPVVKDARTLRRVMEQLIDQMTNLRTFHWGTQILPLSARICRALARCDSLQIVSIGPSGQLYCNSEFLQVLEPSCHV